MIVKSLEHLNSLSKKVADQLIKNDCIFLIGEIGVGKTTFTRYLINYLQEKNGEKITEVLSPTFNLLYEYDLNNIKIIEWPQLINIPFIDKLEVYLDYAKNENEREIKFIGSDKWKILNEL